MIDSNLIGCIVEVPQSIDTKGTPSVEKCFALVRGHYLMDGKWVNLILQTIIHLEGKGVGRLGASTYGGFLMTRALRDCKLCSDATVDEFLKLEPSAAPAAAPKRGGK